ncbi:MAG: hypothetical protein JNJ89_02930 [Rubrivivax sp.]|nr:hypothetical protein [Rubrivivax sp.]
MSPKLARAHRAIAIVDIVESVRLIHEFEDEVIDRWRRFVDEVRAGVLPAWGGRLVKSLGDGMLLEFDTAPAAVNASLELHRRMASGAGGRAAPEILLRIGIHDTEVVVDELDVYGSGVNLAARLSALAGPGETVVSQAAREALVAGFDADIEDLGEVHLKHFEEPQRAFRVGPAGSQPVMWPAGSAGQSDRVSVAVVPFRVNAAEDQARLLGEVLADDLIAQLSKLPQLSVVSRLSTTAFREREVVPGALYGALQCRYAVHGSCAIVGDKVRVRAQLVECDASRVLWADALDSSLAALLVGEGTIVGDLMAGICRALVASEVRRASTLPLPSLESNTILMGAIAMMHRLARKDFERSRQLLDHLVERHPRATAPRAWLGKWHVMRVAQGWSPDPAADAARAHQVVGRALDLDPGHALALAIDGLICAYINKDLATATERYAAAVASNPSEGLAWLFQSALHSYAEHGAQAVECAMRAQRLSPLDPMKYYYDNFTSTAMLSAGDFEGAIEYGQASLRANRTHGPTLRILAIAQVMAGRLADARSSIEGMLRIEPGFSIARFLERYPGAGAPHARRYAEALRTAGLPQ